MRQVRRGKRAFAAAGIEERYSVLGIRAQYSILTTFLGNFPARA
jgi:hypothetical protein